MPYFGQGIDSTLNKLLIAVNKKLVQVVFDVLIWGEGSTIQKNSAETGTSNGPKVPSLENTVGMVALPLHAAIAFGELSNLYAVSHCPVGTPHLILTNSGLFSLSASLNLCS